MKKIAVFFIAVFTFIIMNTGVSAQEFSKISAPRTISYQGYLSDPAKKPVTGDHKIMINLYDSPSDGNLVHTEIFSANVQDGVFSVVIGSQQELDPALQFNKQYWLGLSVDNNAELSPRTAFTSVPYAIHADAASSLSKGATGAVTTLNGKSGNLNIKGGLGTTVVADGNTITITAIPVSSSGGQQIAATTVNSITGTSNQILANGTTGSKQSGDVTLTLPQDIHSGASPTFKVLTLSNFGTAGIIHNSSSGVLSSSLVGNTDVAANAAIAYSKLNLTGLIVNADIAAGANIAASKLNLTNAITTGDIVSGTIVNSDINSGANIAYSKLNLGGSITNSDIAAGANIAGSKLNLTNAITSGSIVAGTIVNSDVNAGANIAYSKLNLGGSITNNDIAAGANIAGSKLNLTNSVTTGSIVAGTIVNSDINAAANISASKINLTNAITSGDIAVGTIMNSDINAAANISASKINLTNAITTGDIVAGTIMNSDINAAANISASKLNLTNAITSGDIASGTIVNSDVNVGAGIVYSKLNLAGGIVNSDIAGGAAIADAKLATISSSGKVSNSATTATSANNANTIALRDASGNFSANTITATLNGNATNVTGTVTETHGGTSITSYTKGDILYASGANALSKRAIGNTGEVLTVSGGVPVWSAVSGVGITSAIGTANQILVNGDANSHTGAITLTLPQNINNAASPTFAGMTLSGLSTIGVVHNSGAGAISTSLIVNADVAAGAAITDSKLATISTAGKVANTATTATSTNTNNAIIARDASGNFSAGTITGVGVNLSGKATSASTLVTDPIGTLTTKDYVDNIAVEYWNIGGNTGIIDGDNYFGTNDATDLSFRTNSVEGLRLTNGGSLLLDGVDGDIPAFGSGTRLMWIPSLGAFRAGGVGNGGEWNSGSIGSYSVAMGNSTTASGNYSFAAGHNTIADKDNAFAMGDGSYADGIGATAIGSGVGAFGDGSTAIGSAAQAGGASSVAMGDNTTALGIASTALGSNTVADGTYSTAMGYRTTTTDNFSTAMGHNLKVGLSSFGFNGSFSSATPTDIVDVSALNNVAYFGDVDIMIGNDDNAARSLKFYGSNSNHTLASTHFTAFKAQTQSTDITYTLPASQGVANSLLTNDGSGNLSWSALSVLSGTGSTNKLALWTSTTALGAGSTLYYDATNSRLGIGASSPTATLDVTGNANVSGTITSGSGITTNGITMSGGAAVLSYGSVVAAATITIPNNAVVKIVDDGANAANSVTMPTGTNGQIIYIYNNDAQATSGDVTVAGTSMGVFVYVDGWKKAN